jgi:hypothetical protein
MAVAPALEDHMRKFGSKNLAILAALLLPGVAGAELSVVIVEGLGGEESYAAGFAEQVERIEAASAGMTDASNVTSFRSGAFTREELLAHFDVLAGRLGADDRLAVFLIGHGSYDDHDYKFNIEGPDLTDGDLARVLDDSRAGSVLLVNTSSSSGATADRLRADDRTLILATRSGAERHATRFGNYFFAALGVERLGRQEQDAGEDIEVVLVRPEKLGGLMDRGEINNAMTAVALSMAREKGFI